MWTIFGISGKLANTVCKAQHSVNLGRYLHFVSDFQHLVKCVQNVVTSTPLLTPNGQVGSEYVRNVPL